MVTASQPWLATASATKGEPMLHQALMTGRPSAQICFRRLGRMRSPLGDGRDQWPLAARRATAPTVRISRARRHKEGRLPFFKRSLDRLAMANDATQKPAAGRET